MDAFAPFPPDWIKDAVHAQPFGCPSCGEGSREAKRVWLNRRAPVFTEGRRRKYQEFYECECNTVWWGWSSDRPPLELNRKSSEDEASSNEGPDEN
ncbi:MAG: hypothetical protein AB8B99_03305 [Phormidesmis sp.]